jgi:Cu(I)/Ag(I) efflux system membrane fusion protein
MKIKAIMLSALIISLLLFIYTPASYSQTHQHESQTGGSSQPQKQNEPPPPQAVEEEEATVEIEPEKQQLIGVKTVEVSVKPMQKIIRTVGRIEYDERRLATVNTKFEGWIEKLHADYTGKYVKKGDPLAEIYSPELVATQQEFLNVIKWTKSEIQSPDSAAGMMLKKDAEKLVDAARQRLKLWDISDEQIKNIEETGQTARTLTIYSPVNGYVVEKMALQGMRVMPGEKLFDLADLSTVWIISDIYEYELALIKVGQAANISLSYFPGKQFTSTIDYIYPSLSGDTKTAKVRFTISNPSVQLKPQMFTNVEIKIDMGRKLAVPDEAVIDTGIRKIVYVDKGEGYFQPREVITGLRADGMTEITAGLKAGEKVASSGTFLIDSEAQLKGVKPVKLSPEP